MDPASSTHNEGGLTNSTNLATDTVSPEGGSLTRLADIMSDVIASAEKCSTASSNLTIDEVDDKGQSSTDLAQSMTSDELTTPPNSRNLIEDTMNEDEENPNDTAKKTTPSCKGKDTEIPCPDVIGITKESVTASDNLLTDAVTDKDEGFSDLDNILTPDILLPNQGNGLTDLAEPVTATVTSVEPTLDDSPQAVIKESEELATAPVSSDLPKDATSQLAQNSAISTTTKPPVRRKRNSDGKIKCQYCDWWYVATYITKHESIHTGTQPFKCETCGLRSLNAQLAAGHTLKCKSGKRIKCEKCGNLFMSTTALTRHVRSFCRNQSDPQQDNKSEPEESSLTADTNSGDVSIVSTKKPCEREPIADLSPPAPSTPRVTKPGTMAWARVHLKTWLTDNLKSGQIPGLCWMDEEKGMFRLPWLFRASYMFKPSDTTTLPTILTIEESSIYIDWAKFCGKFTEREEGPTVTDWRKMREGLCNALANDPNIEEEPTKGSLEGRYMVFKFRKLLEKTTSLRDLDRSQDYPGPWCQELGIKRHHIISGRLSSQPKGVITKNGLVLEFYELWLSRHTAPYFLLDMLTLILGRWRTNRTVTSYVKYLYERHKNLLSCGEKEKAQHLQRMMFVQNRQELDAVFPEMYLGPTVPDCEVVISGTDNIRKRAYLGPHTIAQQVTRLMVLEGKLHKKRKFVLSNAVVLELYQYWKSGRFEMKELTRWLNGILSSEELEEENLFRQIRRMSQYCKQLVDTEQWKALEVLHWRLFRLSEDVPISHSVEPSCNASSPNDVKLKSGMTTYFCVQPLCHTRVKHRIGSTKRSVRMMLCTHHTNLEYDREQAKKRKLSENLIVVKPPEEKCNVDQLKLGNKTSPKDVTSKSGMASYFCVNPSCHKRVGHFVGSKNTTLRMMLCAQHCNQHDREEAKKRKSSWKLIVNQPDKPKQKCPTDQLKKECHMDKIKMDNKPSKICIICNISLGPSIRHINLGIIVPTSNPLTEIMTVRARLEQALKRPMVGNDWMCRMCYSTLLQLEESQRRVADVMTKGNITNQFCVTQNQQQPVSPTKIKAANSTVTIASKKVIKHVGLSLQQPPKVVHVGKLQVQKKTDNNIRYVEIEPRPVMMTQSYPNFGEPRGIGSLTVTPLHSRGDSPSPNPPTGNSDIPRPIFLVKNRASSSSSPDV